MAWHAYALSSRLSSRLTPEQPAGTEAESMAYTLPWEETGGAKAEASLVQQCGAIDDQPLPRTASGAVLPKTAAPRPSSRGAEAQPPRSKSRRRWSLSTSDCLTELAREEAMLGTQRGAALLAMGTKPGEPTDHGELKFPRVHGLPAKWARVPHNAPLKDVLELLTSTWRVPPPSVILSITGAAQGDVPALDAPARAAFEQGLVAAVAETHAWVVTGGTDGGVMRLVGQAMGAAGLEQVVCLGIGCWGATEHHEGLARRRGRIAKYHGATATAASATLDENGARGGRQSLRDDDGGLRACLEPNHTHFLLVDDGTVGTFGGDVDVRAELESFCCNLDRGPAEVSPVMVLIVVAGGPNTLRQICSTLKKQRPVVVLARSGGAAGDLSSYICDGTLPTEPASPASYVAMATELLPTIKALGSERVGLYNAPLLTFFESNSAKEFERFVLHATLANAPLPSVALMHAVAWHNPFIVREQISATAVAAGARVGEEGRRALVSRALQSALAHRAADRTERSLETVALLLDEGEPDLSMLALEPLFASRFWRHKVSIAESLQKFSARGAARTHLMLRCVRPKLWFGMLPDGGMIESFSVEQSDGLGGASRILQRGANASLTLSSIEDAVAEASSNVVADVVRRRHSLTRSTTMILNEAAVRSSTRARERKSKSEATPSTTVKKTTTEPMAGRHECRDTTHEPRSLGLFLLEETCAIVNVRGHRNALQRVKGDVALDVGINDLVLWAALVCDLELARTLWLRAPDPLRYAVMARRVVMSLRSHVDREAAIELTAAADAFESWAVDLLGAIDSSDDAAIALTGVPIARDPQGTWVQLRESSVLDEATSALYPCERIVAHAHAGCCVKDFFLGQRRGAKVAISPKTSVLALWLLYLPLHCLNLLCALRLRWPVVPIQRLSFRPLVSVADMKSDAPGESIDKAKPKVQWDSLGAIGQDELGDDYFKEEEEKGTRASTIAPFELTFADWAAFFDVPKVKYACHALVQLLTLVIATFIVSIRDESPLATVGFGWYLSYNLGRAFEESSEFFEAPLRYCMNGWNLIDLVGLGCIIGAVVTENEYLALDLVSVSLVLLYIQFIQILNVWSAHVGRVWLSMMEMIRSAIPEMGFMALMSGITGIAFVTILSRREEPAEGPCGMSDWLGDRLRPTVGLWGSLGEFGDAFQFLYSDTAIAELGSAWVLWLVVVLYVSTFMTTIVLVNMMVAKMTVTYELVNERAAEMRAMQWSELVIVYKDTRGAPPPINLFVAAFKVLRRLLCCTGKERVSARGFKVAMGAEAESKWRKRMHALAVSSDRMRKAREATTLEARVEAVHKDLALLRQQLASQHALGGDTSATSPVSSAAHEAGTPQLAPRPTPAAPTAVVKPDRAVGSYAPLHKAQRELAELDAKVTAMEEVLAGEAAALEVFDRGFDSDGDELVSPATSPGHIGSGHSQVVRGASGRRRRTKPRSEASFTSSSEAPARQRH